jgi:hypothetical protein
MIKQRSEQAITKDFPAKFKKDIQLKCREIRNAYENGLLGDQTMPEDVHPEFADQESRLAFFTLPMALNYQRNSYELWRTATKTFDDSTARAIFDIGQVSKMTEPELREKLLKHKVALQPNKHTDTWSRLSHAVFNNWGSIEQMLIAHDYDFLKLQKTIQGTHKKDFPYLSGPKIFHYWSYILGEYCGVKLKNKEYIEIAPDTHVVQCSVKLGVISHTEAEKLDKNAISERWRTMLKGSGIAPIDMHSHHFGFGVEMILNISQGRKNEV